MIFFDTVTFRHIGTALENAGLSSDLRERVLVSPLSVFEVLSQLCIAKADEVLRQIRAIHNWINREKAGMLPWPDDALGIVGFGKRVMDEDFTRKMQTAFNVCLTADSVESLREEACKLKDIMDATKLRTAQDFGRLLAAARQDPGRFLADWFSQPWFQGIAKRAGADPNSKSVAELVTTFSAYHEFERVKLQTALHAKDYNVEKHRNDLLDAEQLIYLGSPELCFLTCDKGFERVEKSPQARRIDIVSHKDLSAPQAVEAVLRKCVG